LEDITLVREEAPRRFLPPRPPHKDMVEWMIENLEDITLVREEAPRRFLPPRPPHKDPMEWMIENIEKKSEP